MVDTTQFDLSQISDLVSRNKISDKRKRNEMMRLGTSDPNSFAMQNQQQIQQAQQPSEFWGAGRKEASNQNPDLAAANMVGGLYNLGGTYNYYGDKDTSTAQFGTKGYQTKDLGKGSYDILGQSGQSLGTGYGSVANAINAYRKSRYDQDIAAYNASHVPETTGYEGSIFERTGGTAQPEYRDFNDVLSGYLEPAPVYTPYQSRPGGFGVLEDWEVLGQLLNPQNDRFSLSPGAWNATKNYTGDLRRGVPSNKATESITGLNTLFGSSPLIWDGKLLGYSMDPTPSDKSILGYQNPYSAARLDKEGRTQSAAGLSRLYQNPELWKSLGQSINENQFFVPTENAAKLPGWQNKELSEYARQKNGLFGGVFDVLDPILDTIDPLHDKAQDNVTSLLGKDSQKETFNTVAPMVANLFGGWGAMLNAFNSASQGDFAGGALSALSGGSQLGGTGNLTSNIGNQFKSLGLSPELAKTASGFTTSALTNAARGGDIKSSLGAALFGAGSGAAGDALAKATEGTLGDIGSKMLGGAASGGISSLFNKNSPVAGSLYGAMSGGLHGFLNSTSKSGNQFNQKTDDDNRMKAQTLAKLFKSAIKNKVK